MAIEFRSTKDKIMALAAGVALATAFVGWNFVYKPKQAAAKKLEAARHADTQKADAVRRIAELEKKIAAYKPKLSENRESAWLIQTLNELADRSGINLSLVTPLPRVPGENFFKVPIRIEMTCAFAKLGEFLEAVENHTPVIRVEALRIEGSADPARQADELKVTMTLAALRPAEPL